MDSNNNRGGGYGRDNQGGGGYNNNRNSGGGYNGNRGGGGGYGGNSGGGFNRGGGGFNDNRGSAMNQGGGKREFQDRSYNDRGSSNDRGGFNQNRGGFNQNRGFENRPQDDRDGGGRDEVHSLKIQAGKRTYFLDVKQSHASDYYLTITESKRRLDGFGYEKHKIFLYKEDFNKFLEGLTSVIDHTKSLMPDYDFEEFDRRRAEFALQQEGQENGGNEGFDENDETDNDDTSGRVELD